MSFTLKRGLQNVFVAEVTKDNNSTTQGEGYVTGTPYHLIPAGEMSRTTPNDIANTYFDNAVFHVTGYEGATEITITGAALRPADIAALTGKTVDAATGTVIDTGEFEEKYFALGGETNNVDGTKELFWFLKGTFAIPDQTDKTTDESTDTNGTELTFSAIKTTHLFDVDGSGTGDLKPVKKIVIDTETTVLKTSQVWTDQVVTPENLSTIVQAVV